MNLMGVELIGELVTYPVEVRTDCQLRLDLAAVEVVWLLHKVIVHI